jgi:hypothetical protein
LTAISNVRHAPRRAMPARLHNYRHTLPSTRTIRIPRDLTAAVAVKSRRRRPRAS